MRRNLDGYFLSDDKTLLSAHLVHDFLSRRSYWARGRSREAVEVSISNSLCLGAYTETGEQVGFARAVTDHSTTYYLCDVFVLPEHRGAGLGKALVAAAVEHPELRGQVALLLTRDAHALYRRFGFSDSDQARSLFMLRRPQGTDPDARKEET